LSSYVASHHLTGAKGQFYCTVYYITLNSNCEAQGVSKNLKKKFEKKLEDIVSKIKAWVI
jgi:hypothetical protein